MKKKMINALVKRITKRLKSAGFAWSDIEPFRDRIYSIFCKSGFVRATSYLKDAGTLGYIAIGYPFGKPADSYVAQTHGGYPKIFEPFRKYPEPMQAIVFGVARAVRLETIETFQVPKDLKSVLSSESSDSRDLSNTTVFGVDHLGITDTFRYSGLSSTIWQMKRRDRESNPDYIRRVILEAVDGVNSFPYLKELPWFDAFFEPATNRLSTWVRSQESNPDFKGFYAFKQDRGMKLRLFAWVSDFLQSILQPLKDGLLDTLRNLPTDCTHDQVAGAEWVQHQIVAGKQVYSVDLSSATNNFPLEPQLTTLLLHGVEPDMVETLRCLSRSKFAIAKFVDLPPGTGFLREFPIQWKVGQPLGLSFSFPMFALAHNSLLAGICRRFHLSPVDSFRILGDDVVISNAQVHSEYLRILESSKIPVSHHKCLSGVHAEFAGAKITKDYIIHVGSYSDTTLKTMFSLVERFGLAFINNECPCRYRQELKLWLFHSKGEYNESDYSWLLKANSLMNEEPFPRENKFPWGPSCFSVLCSHLFDVLIELDPDTFSSLSSAILMMTDKDYRAVLQSSTRETAVAGWLESLQDLPFGSELWISGRLRSIQMGSDPRTIVWPVLNQIYPSRVDFNGIIELYDSFVSALSGVLFCHFNSVKDSARQLMRRLSGTLEIV